MELLVDEWTYIDNAYYNFVKYFLTLIVDFIKEEPFPYFSKKVWYYLQLAYNPKENFYFIENHTIIWLYGFYVRAIRQPFYTFDWIFEMEFICQMDYIEIEQGASAKKKALYPPLLQFELITINQRNFRLKITKKMNSMQIYEIAI